MNGPLTASHLPAINRALQTLADIQTVVSKCKNCGIDLAEAQQMIDMQRETLLSIKREFLTPDNYGMAPGVPRE